MSENKDQTELTLTGSDIKNILGYINNFPEYQDYEKQYRFTQENIEAIEKIITWWNDK